MRIPVTEEGLVIPKELLAGIKVVEVHREKDQIILTSALEEDPIWDLGSDPISLGLEDAAVNHDRYLYGSL